MIKPLQSTDPVLVIARAPDVAINERVIMFPVKSTRIGLVGHSEYTGSLFVMKTSPTYTAGRGPLIRFEGVPPSVAREIRRSESVGRSFVVEAATQYTGREVQYHCEGLDYAYSLDEERYHGGHGSRLKALEAAYFADGGGSQGAFVGYAKPIPASRYFRRSACGDFDTVVDGVHEATADVFDLRYADDWIDTVSEAPDRAGLERALALAFEEWAQRQNVEPTFFEIGGAEWMNFALLADEVLDPGDRERLGPPPRKG